jgi:ferredoxin
MMPWHLEVDRERCIGSGLCAGTAPEAFELADDRSRPIHPRVDPDEALLLVAENCPVEAITVRDHTGRRLAPPAD